MGKVIKRLIVIGDLITLATYIAEGNLDISDSFLIAAEKTLFNWVTFLSRVNLVSSIMLTC